LSLSIGTFQKFPGTFDLLLEVSKSQHRTKLRITKFDRERNQSLYIETGNAEHCSEDTTISKKVATALRGNGLIQFTKTSTKVSAKWKRNIECRKKRWNDQLHLER